jgi:hypothetical protein
MSARLVRERRAIAAGLTMPTETQLAGEAPRMDND